MYIGVTNNLERRMSEHKAGLIEGFTKKYNIRKLVYYEDYYEIKTAIDREKTLKGWIRAKKNALVETENPKWQDLSKDWYGSETVFDARDPSPSAQDDSKELEI